MPKPIRRRNGIPIHQEPKKNNPFANDPLVNPNWTEDGPVLGNFEVPMPIGLNELVALLERHRTNGLIEDMVNGEIPNDTRALNTNQRWRPPPEDRKWNYRKNRRVWVQERLGHEPRRPTPRTKEEVKARNHEYYLTQRAKLIKLLESDDPEVHAKAKAIREAANERSRILYAKKKSKETTCQQANESPHGSQSKT